MLVEMLIELLVEMLVETLDEPPVEQTSLNGVEFDPKLHFSSSFWDRTSRWFSCEKERGR